MGVSCNGLQESGIGKDVEFKRKELEKKRAVCR